MASGSQRGCRIGLDEKRWNISSGRAKSWYNGVGCHLPSHARLENPCHAREGWRGLGFQPVQVTSRQQGRRILPSDWVCLVSKQSHGGFWLKFSCPDGVATYATA